MVLGCRVGVDSDGAAITWPAVGVGAAVVCGGGKLGDFRVSATTLSIFDTIDSSPAKPFSPSSDLCIDFSRPRHRLESVAARVSPTQLPRLSISGTRRVVERCRIGTGDRPALIERGSQHVVHSMAISWVSRRS